MSNYNLDDFNKAESDRVQGSLSDDQYKAYLAILEWFYSDSLEFTLSGYAGTGKTFITKRLIEDCFRKVPYTVSAPTHKALRVIENHLDTRGKTIQSLHGLRLNTNIESFNIDNLQFSKIGDGHIQFYKLIILDEASMVPSGILSLNRKASAEHGTKILYLGDPYQLPPVRERISGVFTDVKCKYNLTEVIRQKEDNPMLTVFNLIRSDIDKGTSKALNHLMKYKKNINNNDEGYAVLDKHTFPNVLMSLYDSDEFFTNISHIRTACYTNDAVGMWNEFVRTNMFDTGGNALIENDLLTSYKSLVDANNQMKMINSEDYIIKDFHNYKNDLGFKTFTVVLQNTFDHTYTDTIQIIDHRDPETIQRYLNILSSLQQEAASKRKWDKYYSFKETYLCMKDLIINGKKTIRDIDCGYALTVHKLQGTTLDYIAVDMEDIVYNYTNGRRTAYPTSTRNRLLYVALSRASKTAFLKW